MPETPSHYEITSDTKSTTILLQPDIGNAAWGDIEQVGTELLTSVDARKSSAWLIDLSRLNYMGSALVALLVRVWKAVQAGGGKVVVVCGDGMPRDVIRLAGLDKVWTISTTTAEGYKSLGVRTPVASAHGSAAAESVATPQPEDGVPILGLVSFVAALAAGGVLAVVMLELAEIDRNLAQLGMFGGAGIAVALGLLSLFKENSWGRGLGLLALLAGFAVGAMGYMERPAAPAAVPPQDGESQSDPADPENAASNTQPPADEVTMQPGASDPGPEHETDNSADPATNNEPDTTDQTLESGDESETTSNPEDAPSEDESVPIDPPSTEESGSNLTESE